MHEPTADSLQTAAPQTATAPVDPPPLPVEGASAAHGAAAPQRQPSIGRTILAFFGRAAKRIDDWMCGEGRWYLGSAAIHAVAILSLGLIAIAVPPRINPQDAVSMEGCRPIRRRPWRYRTSRSAIRRWTRAC